MSPAPHPPLGHVLRSLFGHGPAVLALCIAGCAEIPPPALELLARGLWLKRGRLSAQHAMQRAMIAEPCPECELNVSGVDEVGLQGLESSTLPIEEPQWAHEGAW